MVFISALIAVEKLLPWRRLATATVVLLLAALGVGLMAAPSDVPGLTIPGSPAAQRAMNGMHMHSGGMSGMQMHTHAASGMR
jgi:hypothetical protein